MAITQLARILVVVTSVAFAVSLSLIRREVVTGYSSEDREKILDEHNHYRRIVTPTASDMEELKWDDDLSSKAQDLANECVFEHSIEPGIGQNIYVSTMEPSVKAPIKYWHDEVENFSYNNGCANGKVCGHYTQVAWASTRDVGCGIQHCPSLQMPGDATWNGWMVVCNYKPGGNYIGQRPYKTGGQCTECGEGQTCKDGLCTDTQ